MNCDWCGSTNTMKISKDWCANIYVCQDCSHEFYVKFEPGEDQDNSFWELLKEFKKDNNEKK